MHARLPWQKEALRVNLAAQPRVIDWIPGALNLRDFGGYATTAGGKLQNGLLFRSGATHGIATEGLAQIAKELRVRTVIDLRSPGERKRWLSPFESHGITCFHLPLDPGLGMGMESGAPPLAVTRAMALGLFDWGQLYWSLLALNGQQFARIFEVLSEPRRLPVLVHCAGGRDRTGVTVALIQAALSVADDDIASDYALSSEMIGRAAPRPEFERLFGEVAIPREEIARAMTTRPEVMLDLLARVRTEHGGVRALLNTWGIADEVLERIEHAILT
jgi:protein-tyrosine phosphatase